MRRFMQVAAVSLAAAAVAAVGVGAGGGATVAAGVPTAGIHCCPD